MQWSPKPLRPLVNLPSQEGEVVVKGLSPIERQRQKDGTPHTSVRPGFKPADPKLVIKGSLAEKLPEAQNTPEADPPVYNQDALDKIVKSYLNS